MVPLEIDFCQAVGAKFPDLGGRNKFAMIFQTGHFSKGLWGIGRVCRKA